MTFQLRFLIDELCGLEKWFCLNPKNSKIKNLYWSLSQFRIWKQTVQIRQLRRFNDGIKKADIIPRFLLKIRSVRILDTLVCSKKLLWLFSPSWDAVNLTLKVGFIWLFVVIDPTDLGATRELLFQALSLSIFNLSRTPNTCANLSPTQNTCKISPSSTYPRCRIPTAERAAWPGLAWLSLPISSRSSNNSVPFCGNYWCVCASGGQFF